MDATDPIGIPAVPPVAQKYDPLAFNSRRMFITTGVLLFSAAVGAVGVAFGYNEGKTGADDYYQPQNDALSREVARLRAERAHPPTATTSSPTPRQAPSTR